MDGRRDRGPRPAVTAYTEQDWEDQSYALLAEGSDPEQCPECGLTGFYGPRAREGALKYRECRFCGFYQMVGQRPRRLRPVVHDCEEWPEIADAPYIWWIASDERWYECSFCGKRTPVERSNTFVRGTGIVAPSDDPTHPWWHVPQDQSYAYYREFWARWPCTKGRVVL